MNPQNNALKMSQIPHVSAIHKTNVIICTDPGASSCFTRRRKSLTFFITKVKHILLLPTYSNAMWQTGETQWRSCFSDIVEEEIPEYPLTIL
jgi:hypothetical protein